MTEEFDLHAALTGRAYPTGTVKIWLNEEPWYELDALEKKHASFLADDPGLAVIENRIVAAKLAIDDMAYTVHLRGISPRAGEDIISAALSEYPFKRDMYGRDDDFQAIKRSRHIAELSFAAHIIKVINPDGREVLFTDDNRRDRARMILGEAPKSAIERIDAGIAAVSHDFREQQEKFTSPDFL